MEKLNQNVRDTSSKFTNLLQMASVKLAGFEYNDDTQELFYQIIFSRFSSMMKSMPPL